MQIGDFRPEKGVDSSNEEDIKIQYRNSGFVIYVVTPKGDVAPRPNDLVEESYWVRAVFPDSRCP